MIVQPEPIAALDPHAVLGAVSDFFGLSLAQLSGDLRGRITWPRHEAIYALRTLTTLSYSQIGKLFGGRDTKTIMNSCQRVTDRLLSDEEYGRTIERFVAYIHAWDARPAGADVISIARRKMNSPDAEGIAIALITVASILTDRRLTDAEARLGAMQVVGGKIHG